MANNILYIALGVLALAFVLVRQVQKRPVKGARLFVILGVIGLFEIFEYARNHSLSGTGTVVLLGSLVVAAVFGVIRAYTVRITNENGVLYRQGNALTMVLWVVAIGVHFGLDLLLDSTARGLATSALLLYLAVSLGVQQGIVQLRAGQLGLA